MERIPRDADAWRKIMLRRLVHVFTKWRSRGPAIESGWTSLNILRVNNHAVAEVSTAGAAVSSPSDDWCIGSFPKTRVEIRKHSVAIFRRSQVRVANAKTKSQAFAHTP